MARSNKPAPFAIYEDTPLDGPQDSGTGIIGSEPAQCEVTTEEENPVESGERQLSTDDEENVEGAEDNATPSVDEQDVETDGDADDERRQSLQSRASISSVPESTWQTDIEKLTPTHPPYTPPVMRPAFMRAESVRRMQMASPPPFDSKSSRRSVVRQSMSRNGTPRSVRSATAKGSPRPRRVVSEDSGAEPETVKDYPLVLLHVTILPAAFPWSQESMTQLLPKSTLHYLDLLQTKVSETVLQRGILIPHPRHEYELLEERLLEALELRQERVTKCGHFRDPQSAGSDLYDDSSGRDSDSGMGSSIDGDEGITRCTTCRHHVKDAKYGVERKWSIEVYASNGLMRASAWAAVWNDMERVDVRIMPFITADLRKQLDEFKRFEGSESKSATPQGKVKAQSPTISSPRVLEPSPLSFLYRAAVLDPPSKAEDRRLAPLPPSQATEFPKIYKKTSDVPITLLLKNYLALLAQDPKNIAIFFLVLGLIMIAVRQPSPASTEPQHPPQVQLQNETVLSLPLTVPSSNATMPLLEGAAQSPDVSPVAESMPTDIEPIVHKQVLPAIEEKPAVAMEELVRFSEDAVLDQPDGLLEEAVSADHEFEHL